MHYFVRRIVFLILYVLYVPFKKLLGSHETSVLMYHSIAGDGWFFSVTPKDFEEQIAYIAEHCHPVTLAEIADFIAGKIKLLPRSVAVTFDDGYKNFLTDALPILEKYKVPAILFVCAGDVDRSEVGNVIPLLSPEELRHIAASNLITIGSHGVTHHKLTRMKLDDARNEISSSRVLIEKQIDRPVEFLA